ncbi:MAG: methyltransferase domain-containing protein [Chloroflexi bacterium]|nr:methyltransferase domain-containing protein [Chloroflexota bacterium]MDA1227129.1 methyltransferase domain-containing protein [Chloroflexota bacterium]
MANAPGDQDLQKDEYAFSYDSVMTTEYHAGRTAEANAAFFLPYLKPGMSLLDCGCGPGSITVGLAERVAPGQVIGIDVGESSIALAQRLAVERGVTNVRFEVASAYELPFPENTFDAVFSHNMPEHLQDPLKAFEEMQRVLKPGGVIGVRDVDASGLLAFGPVEKRFRSALNIFLEDWLKVSGTPYMGRRLRVLLRDAGFKRLFAQGSYDKNPTEESLTSMMDIFATACEEPAFIDRVIESGLADERKMNELALAIREFGRHPDSFFANAHCEAVGWKG